MKVLYTHVLLVLLSVHKLVLDFLVGFVKAHLNRFSFHMVSLVLPLNKAEPITYYTSTMFSINAIFLINLFLLFPLFMPLAYLLLFHFL